MRSTEVQIWPAFAKAPSAACDAAQTGSTSASISSGSLPPFSRMTCTSFGTAAAASERPVAVEPTCAVTAHVHEHPLRQLGGEDRVEQGAGMRAALARLVHHGVPGDDRGAEQAG